jgi:hypothetical protein
MTPGETVEAFITALTNGEPARAAERAADDIVYDNIGLAQVSFEFIVPTINGRQAMLEYLAPLQGRRLGYPPPDLVGAVGAPGVSSGQPPVWS